MEKELGARYYQEKGTFFRVWAPSVERMDLKILLPEPRTLPMGKGSDGYHELWVKDAEPGCTYLYRLGEKLECPDPVSMFQPDGVHGPSAVLKRDFVWQDGGWCGLPVSQYIIYELHVGTFTTEGTFDAIIPKLPYLKELGVSAIELMPVAQFPGERNWGYDGVGLFAVQNSYGGPDGLKRLVNACHLQGLAVVLDVVYNHLGPEGNYLSNFGPYFTDAYSTPWGPALNFDGPESGAVRNFFLQNALYWQAEFHIDALRLDAVHAIKDFSALPFMEELSSVTQRRAEQLNRRFHLIAENDLNNQRFVLPPSIGGYGLQAQWNDDFHHALHVLLTDERNGYYEDFGGVECLAKCFREGYVYTGEYSKHRRRKHGNATHLTNPKQFVVCSQNHDQIGNRFLGDRLSAALSFESMKLAAGVVLLSPFIPLLFMGEEYGEVAPFQYFISHTDPGLVEAVRKGRKAEFASFGWQGEVPDPQAEATFLKCKLNHALREQGKHRLLLAFYRKLIQLRKELSAIREVDKAQITTQVNSKQPALLVRYSTPKEEIALVFSFADSLTQTSFAIPEGNWAKLIDSESIEWGGANPGPSTPLLSQGAIDVQINPRSLVAFRKL